MRIFFIYYEESIYYYVGALVSYGLKVMFLLLMLFVDLHTGFQV